MSIPKDGYYICRLIQDTGGEVTRYVRVLDGSPYLPSGHAVLSSACSHFRPVELWEFCGTWPDIAATELDALRTANKALVERVKRLEEAGSLALGYCAKGDLESADEVWGKAKEAKP